MPGISKPILAATIKDVESLKYGSGLGASYKLDGIRCLKPTVDGVKSRSLKDIANKHIRAELSEILPVGADGEIMVGATFQEVTSSVMSHSGTPDYTYHMFDLVEDVSDPYHVRVDKMVEWYERIGKSTGRVELVLPTIVHNAEELLAFEEKSLSLNYEGVIVRDMNAPYKNGRSTLREQYLLKLKRFLDSEAEILGVDELFTNGNAPTTNELGHTARSSHKENLIPAGMMGGLRVRDLTTGIEFVIGTGFDMQLRQDMWDNQDALTGQIVKYKYFPVGVKDAPRHPVYLGIRSKEDMGE